MTEGIMSLSLSLSQEKPPKDLEKKLKNWRRDWLMNSVNAEKRGVGGTGFIL